jgi:rod shape-determining protein MreD
VRIAGVVLATAVAMALQTTLARFVVRGTFAVDLVLVVVVYAALTMGPVTGVVTGAVAGILQDVLSGGVVGIGGGANTIVGFLAGLAGAQFIVTGTPTRFLIFFAATVVRAVVFMGLYMLLELRQFSSPYGVVAAQAFANALVGIGAFRLVESIPAAVARRRSMGSGIRR